MSTLLTVTPPALEPVDLVDAKAHLRVDGTQDDALITSLITAARQVAEGLLGRALITQTLRYVRDEAPARDFTLPRTPLQSITHVKVYDDADNATLVPATQYLLDAPSGRVALRNGAVWPSIARSMNGFEVQYVAGYGSAASDVPMALRRGLLAHVAHLYLHRGDSLTREGVSEAMTALPREALVLYAPYRLFPGVA